MRRARFARPGLLAIKPEAWGIELDERGGQADRGFLEEGDAAIVDIRGPLLKRAEGFWALFCDDYESIRERAQAAFASGSRRVILRIDSPGGDAAGCFELARELRAMAQASGKQLIAYADGLMCSAAYAIACAASRIETAPTSYVGSIGVFEAIVDWTAQSAAMGLKVVVVSSGEYKTDRNPDVPITDEAIARVQGQVDEFAGLFFDLVAELRGGTADQWRGLKGAIFLGDSAFGVGLVDAVSAWGDVVTGSTSEDPQTMSTNASKYDEAIGALKRCADGDDEEAKKAKKALKAIEDGDKEPKKEDDGAAAEPPTDEKKNDEAKKAKAAEDEKKKDEEAKARAAAAASSTEIDLARRVQELEAERAQEKDAKARADLFAKRPDFSEAVKATLAKAPLAMLEEAVKSWPRASASPGASANAITPGVTGGEPAPKAAYTPRLTAEEQALLDKCEAKVGGPKKAQAQGNVLIMPTDLTQDEARARLAEIDKELGR